MCIWAGPGHQWALLERYEKLTLKIKLEKNCYLSCGAETKDLLLEDQKGYIRGCEEFEYLRVKKDDRLEDIKNWNNKARVITAILIDVLWNRNIIRTIKLQLLKSIVKRTVTYRAGMWTFKQRFTIKAYVDGNRSTRCSRL
jgi:hypothetical protein